MYESIAARYYVVLKDVNGNQLAIFDNPISIHFEKRVNEVGSYILTFADNGDGRFSYFGLDSRVEIYRSIPAGGLKPYCEFYGFHRTSSFEVSDSGEAIFTSSGFDYNSLLQRSTVAYKAGTIRADKSIESETAIKEYVEENCGITADDTVVGRLYQGGFPGFIVEGSQGYGAIWTGSRAFENLLDVIKDIALFGNLDFAVLPNGNGFIFRTFPEQLGENRTTEGLYDGKGVNSYGNQPVVFSIRYGNVSDIKYTYDRSREANVVIVPGKGDGSTRTTVTVADTTLIDDSPYNRIETSRSAGSYDEDFETYSLTTSGQETLNELRPQHIIEFSPLQQPSTLYGLHYFLGDKITVEFKGVDYHKKVVGVSADFDDDREKIGIEFSDTAY